MTDHLVQPLSLADVADLARAHGEDRFNLFMKEFVDALSHPSRCTPAQQQSMILREPVLLTQPMLNAFLAGVAEFVAQRSDVDVPAWAVGPDRFLREPVFWGRRPQTHAHMLVETPGPFRRRNLFCGYVWLHSSRWGCESVAV